ncbi:unnamed protein product [Effrenium voratum]|uniref:Uncharacterized protein n=1 Tax=Effrenium voratum TaxID=2562239 RepID=A0AA36IW93_9DINO|nr:unnamed protein product [Effrenium voratum]
MALSRRRWLAPRGWKRLAKLQQLSRWLKQVKLKTERTASGKTPRTFNSKAWQVWRDREADGTFCSERDFPKMEDRKPSPKHGALEMPALQQSQQHAALETPALQPSPKHGALETPALQPCPNMVLWKRQLYSLAQSMVLWARQLYSLAQSIVLWKRQLYSRKRQRVLSAPFHLGLSIVYGSQMEDHHKDNREEARWQVPGVQ